MLTRMLRKSSNILVVEACTRKYNVSHATAASLPVRDPAERRAAAPHAPLCGVVPLRVQQGTGPAKRALRTGGEETQLRGVVPVAHAVEERHGDALVGGRAHPPLAASAEGSGASTRTSLRAVRTSRASSARDGASAFATPMRNNSRSTRSTTGSSGRSSAGFDTATAGRCWERRRTSP
jgi:hypothetical protein